MMDSDRRGFLKAAGLGALGIACGPIVNALEGAESLPEEHPLVGKRWAMVIDLAKCREQGEGCTACIDACHIAHNVPDFDDSRHEIKWIWKEPFGNAFEETEHEYLTEELAHSHPLVLCNHCDNPPCVRACPTGATFKRDDGIVMMDWHRCIGCRYCMAACPYGSRSFNWRDPRPGIDDVTRDFPVRARGVVDKCTFCDERIARGRLPACVEACPVGAMKFGDL
ncbi:MAG: 4Fe-4S dicluster domain-containing protein, partial [Candidatus Electryoneaceae bacterium]|nr:4Fe-4S dicluster domain-containing protein [Candidatus Electryoneaceae bacterium]